MKRRGTTPVIGVLMVALACWLVFSTLRGRDGPWGRPGVAGTLTITDCSTERHGGGDPPSTSCTGMFKPDHGGSPVPRVELDRGASGPRPSGETVQVRLPQGSHHAYQPGGIGWLLELGFALIMLAAGLYTFHSTGAPSRDDS